jgi:hypothetical protein
VVVVVAGAWVCGAAAGWLGIDGEPDEGAVHEEDPELLT